MKNYTWESIQKYPKQTKRRLGIDYQQLEQLIVWPKAEDIVDVVIGQPGPTSDIKICRQTLSKFDSQQTFIGDKAYLGENQSRTPEKKNKNGELTENQIKENKVLSSRRIFVEHLIRFVKVFKAG
jgi:IS5 family transposase